MPDGTLYSAEHELALRVEGLEKPRRKRGRPPKPAPLPENEDKQEQYSPPDEDDTLIIDADGRQRRRRKVPSRFLEAVQVINSLFNNLI